MRLVWLALLVPACSVFRGSPERHSSYDEGYQGYYADVTRYRVLPDRKTPKGIPIDDPTHLVEDSTVDRMVDELEACMSQLPTKWTTDQIKAGHCLGDAVPRLIRRDWFDVKIPPDWYVSSCTSEVLFSCDVDPGLCGLKPELSDYTDNPECPCACRAVIQGNRTIVTTHKLNLFKATLTRLVTGCNLPWYIEPLNACLN